MSHLKNVLDNCLKKEHREKQTLLLTRLEVLFDISALVNSRTLDGTTVIPYSSKILNRLITHKESIPVVDKTNFNLATDFHWTTNANKLKI